MSLLDDPGVLAGLENLEPAQPRGSAASDPAFQARMHALDCGLTDLSSPQDDQLPQFAAEPSDFADAEPLDEPEQLSTDWKIVLTSYSWVWLFCGSLGAAVAAVVFHAEVSRLMGQWTSAVTALWS